MFYPLDWCVKKIKELEGRINSISSDSGGGTPFVPNDYFLFGSGSPEGVVTGAFINQPYLNTDDNGLWVFNGTPGANTGWH